MAGMKHRTYLTVTAQLVTTDAGHSTAYYSDLVRHSTRQDAIHHGLRSLGHDDFVIATMCGDTVVRVGWMGEDRDDPDERADLAHEFGWEFAGA